jgi:hypothetical protein
MRALLILLVLGGVASAQPKLQGPAPDVELQEGKHTR